MWVKNIVDLELQPPLKFDHWMRKPKNMGEALRRVCHLLSVNILNQELNYPLKDEIEILGLANLSTDKTTCYLRKIFLEGNGIPFCYGRVVVSKSVYINHREEFDSLGNKLIGETLLYNNPKTIRSDFEYTQLKKNHLIFDHVMQSLPLTSRIPESLWARRSVFYINGIEPLLVTEVFMEEIPLFID